jgi:hypothetical protein
MGVAEAAVVEQGGRLSARLLHELAKIHVTYDDRVWRRGRL